MNAYPARSTTRTELMGFFEQVGRHVEKFKQSAKDAADEDADYQCQSCNTRFNTSDDQCPDCGSTEVVSTPED